MTVYDNIFLSGILIFIFVLTNIICSIGFYSECYSFLQEQILCAD